MGFYRVRHDRDYFSTHTSIDQLLISGSHRIALDQTLCISHYLYLFMTFDDHIISVSPRIKTKNVGNGRESFLTYKQDFS